MQANYTAEQAGDYSTLINSWNDTLSVISEIVDIPVALVMRVERSRIEVFCKNHGRHNPYSIGDAEDLEDSGLYCEHVLKTGKTLMVANALNDPLWDSNPDIKLGMISYLGMPIFNVDDKAFGTICVLDVKERQYSEVTIRLIDSIKQSFEAQLRQLHYQHKQDEQRNYKEILELAAGMAHEINTPLGIGVTAASHLEHELRQWQETLKQGELSSVCLRRQLPLMVETAELLNRNLGFAAEKVNSLKEMAVNEFSYEEVPCDLAEVVDDAMMLYQLNLRQANVSYRLDAGGYRAGQVQCCPSLVIQIITGLMQNSLLHGFTDIADPEISLSLETRNGENLLHYRDNGRGIPVDNREKVFFPFFTTRRHDGSTGLGLSVIKRIVTQQLRGDITLESSSHGVHFRISLPFATSRKG